jgi:hypothetical protein
MRQFNLAFGQSQLNSIPLAFDGRNNIYTTRPLPFEEESFQMSFEDVEEHKKIDFKISMLNSNCS